MDHPDPCPGALRSAFRAGLIIFLVSAAVRLALLPFVPLDPAFTMRWETAVVARQLLQTGEYANPYILPSGPTAHAVPFHTALMFLIIKLFGVTMAAEYARCALTIVSFSIMHALLPWFATRFGLGLRAGFLGGLIGALNPLHLQISITGGIAEEFAAMALGLLMAASFRRWTSGSVRVSGSLLLGVAWGAAFHISPVLLLVLIAFALFDVFWIKDRAKWLSLALIAAGVILACASWTWRNYNALGGFVFIRSKLGLELRMGNHPGVGVSMEETDRRSPAPHPTTQIEEARKVAILGELEYMRRWDGSSRTQSHSPALQVCASFRSGSATGASTRSQPPRPLSSPCLPCSGPGTPGPALFLHVEPPSCSRFSPSRSSIT